MQLKHAAWLMKPKTIEIDLMNNYLRFEDATTTIDKLTVVLSFNPYESNIPSIVSGILSFVAGIAWIGLSFAFLNHF